MDEGDFAGVAHAVEHAFAEERGAEAYAVESAGQLIVMPGFDTVGEAHVVKADVCAHQAIADPRPIRTGLGTGSHRRFKIIVEADFEFALPQHLLHGAFWDVE